MLFVLVCVVAIIVGVLLLRFMPGDIDWDVGGSAIIVFAIAVLVVLGIIILVAQISGPGDVAKAQAVVAWMETLCDNPQVQQQERENALDWYMKLSGSIAQNRAFRDSPLLGWFYYHSYGDITLPSLASIPPANPLQGIELKKGE